ncbi:MAG: ABC transporter ATP-binding protein [Oscillospiraceae bacterium]|nr:ABC transporter ATP-binding protein [Oscillospiraceae bacterium]
MLEVKQICKSYRGNSILSDVNFCLPKGQCLGIVGSNGSGKSTLLRILAQIERPDSGDVRCGGKSILGDRHFMRTRTGYVPQDNELAPDLTVAQQLKLWQSACGMRGAIPGEITELLGLAELMPKRTQDLSGGMQRRVSIAMALLNSPDILFMDEATTGLDRAYCPQLLDWLEDFLKRGGRILWCSHVSSELDRLCGSCLHFDV